MKACAPKEGVGSRDRQAGDGISCNGQHISRRLSSALQRAASPSIIQVGSRWDEAKAACERKVECRKNKGIFVTCGIPVQQLIYSRAAQEERTDPERRSAFHRCLRLDLLIAPGIITHPVRRCREHLGRSAKVLFGLPPKTRNTKFASMAGYQAVERWNITHFSQNERKLSSPKGNT